MKRSQLVPTFALALAAVAAAAPAAPPPSATAADLRSAMRRASAAQLATMAGGMPIDWEAATFYAGLVAQAKVTNDPADWDVLRQVGARNHWTPAARKKSPFHADDVCVCQTFLDVYDQTHDPAVLAPTRAAMDKLVQHLAETDGKGQPTWWWCDALFMAPAALAHLSADTGNPGYLDAMSQQWWRVSDLLYDGRQHLFYRDKRFLPTTGPTTAPALAGGPTTRPRPVFWSRGNGWVMGGLARVLARMPADYPQRPRFVAQLRAMAERLAQLQPADGLWRADLLADPATAIGETSGTALDCYAMAWGVNHGLLDRGRFLPVLGRAWGGLRRSVRPDGQLGYDQPAGDRPGKSPAGSATIFGNGAFLLAASELLPLADALPPASARP
jgi:unsaturated rhamnogalacturonyl hydrolase